MRPATLPPASTTYNPGASGYNSATYAGDPGVRNPYIYPPGPTSIGPTGAANTVFASGVAFSTVTAPPGMTISMPPPIPARRLFQIPDAYGPTPNPPAATPTPPPPALPTVSNASDSGDPFINVVTVKRLPAWRREPWGRWSARTGTYYLNNGYPNLVWSGNTPTVTTPTA